MRTNIFRVMFTPAAVAIASATTSSELTFAGYYRHLAIEQDRRIARRTSISCSVLTAARLTAGVL
jgi:hypothetical protein